MVVSLRWAALGALLCAWSAQATTLLVQDLPGLSRAATLIVRGTVVESHARWTPDGARIMTDTTVRVSERWKGAAGDSVVVMQPGGEVGEVGQLVHGVARFSPGEDVVLFLEGRGDRFLVTGMLQGKFVVERSSDGKAQFARQALEGEALFVDPATRQAVRLPPVVLGLDELRAQVLKLAAQPAPASPAPSPRAPVKVTP